MSNRKKPVPKSEVKDEPISVVDDPKPPERSRSAMLFYFIQYRSDLMEDNPDLTFEERSRRLGAMWKNASEEEKKKCSDLAEEDRIRYNKEVDEYHKFLKSKKSQTEKPKRRPSAYNLFYRDHCAEAKASDPMNEFGSVQAYLGHMWCAAHPDLRAIYQEKAKSTSS